MIYYVPIKARAYIPSDRNETLLHTSSYTPCRSCLRGRSNSIRYLRLYLRDHAQQILHDLIPRLTPCLLDLLQLLVCVFAGVFFCFLVAACVLSIIRRSAAVLATSMGGQEGVCVCVEWESTFFSYSLNSSSFCFR